MNKKIVIIGAGPGGLATAMLLASTGAKVTVVERLQHVGGRTSTHGAHGYKFDLGPTFFLYPRVLKEIFQTCGRELQREVEMVRLDPQYRIMFGGGGTIDATANIRLMEHQIASICPQDAAGFSKFLQENRAKLEMFEPCLEKPFEGWKDLLNLRMLKLLPHLRPHQSMDAYLKRFFSDARVRLAFSFQSKYLGMSPFRCPSLFSILSFLEYEHGVWHPIGGCGSVSTGMARIAREMGVEIILDQPVEEILFKGRRAIGVRTRQGVIDADGIVVNADFARAMQRLVPNGLRRRWTDGKLAKKKYSCSTFMMYLGVEGEYEHPHHTIHIADDYVKNLDEIENKHVLSDDPSFYVQNPCVTDATMSPRGHSSLYLLAPVTHQHGNVDWNADKNRYRNLLLRQAAKAGYGDLEKRIRYERIVTPADWDVDYEIYRGATFNLAHSLDQLLHLRPQNRFEDLDGVYLVGGGTHPGSGLPVIYESARITSRLLAEDLGLKLRDINWSNDPIGATRSTMAAA